MGPQLGPGLLVVSTCTGTESLSGAATVAPLAAGEGPEKKPPHCAATVYWKEVPGASPFSVYEVVVPGSVATTVVPLETTYWPGAGASGDGDQCSSTVECVVRAVSRTGLGVIVVTVAEADGLERPRPAATTV
jgi:hypothetical protein